MTEQDQRPVLFFDIDNCLYPSSARVHDLMGDLIDKFFITHLSLSPADANTLHQTYYKQYGLAIEGLTRHHKIDALEFNRLVDDALPLDTVLAPIPALTKLLEDIEKKQVKLWLFTNAYINHGRRVVRLLDVERFFEGMTYSDYAAINRGEKMVCKPTPEAYEKAMKEAGVRNVEDCYFVDDSYINCRGAHELGWTTAHLLEPDKPEPAEPASKYQIRSLDELRTLFPQFFKSRNSRTSG